MPSTYQSVYIKILMLVYIYIHIHTHISMCIYIIYIKYIVYIHCNCLKRKSSNMSSLSIKSPKKQVRPKQRLTVHRRKGSIQLTLACLIGTTVVSLMVRHHLFWKISVFHGFSIKGKAAKFANTSKESHETSKALSKLGITAILFQPSGSTNQMKRTRHSHTCQGHFTKRSVAAIGAAADIMTCVLYIQAK